MPTVPWAQHTKGIAYPSTTAAFSLPWFLGMYSLTAQLKWCFSCWLAPCIQPHLSLLAFKRGALTCSSLFKSSRRHYTKQGYLLIQLLCELCLYKQSYCVFAAVFVDKHMSLQIRLLLHTLWHDGFRARRAKRLAVHVSWNTGSCDLEKRDGMRETTNESCQICLQYFQLKIPDA